MFHDANIHGSTHFVSSSDWLRSMQWSFVAKLFRTRGTVFSYETNFDSLVLQAMKAVPHRAQPTLFHLCILDDRDCQPRCKRTRSVYHRFFLRVLRSRGQRLGHINFPNNDPKTLPTSVICSVISLSSRSSFRYTDDARALHTLHCQLCIANIIEEEMINYLRNVAHSIKNSASLRKSGTNFAQRKFEQLAFYFY